jgi:hypothetical protein
MATKIGFSSLPIEICKIIMDKVWPLKYNLVMEELKTLHNTRMLKFRECLKAGYFISETMYLKLSDSEINEIVEDLPDMNDYSALCRVFCKKFMKTIDDPQHPILYTNIIEFQAMQNGLEQYYSLSLLERENTMRKAQNYDSLYFEEYQGRGRYGIDNEVEYFSTYFDVDDIRKIYCISETSREECLYMIISTIKARNKFNVWSESIKYFIYKVIRIAFSQIGINDDDYDDDEEDYYNNIDYQEAWALRFIKI